MSICSLAREQILPISIDEYLDFFSDSNNLELIAPPSSGFEITSEVESEIYEGMIITYNVNPFPGISTTCVTEITHVEKHKYFLDEQRIRPFKLCHHQHFFIKDGNGIIVEDIANYAFPFAPLENLLKSIYIRRNLDNIFDYINKVLKNIIITNRNK